jgi:hypothetical protein
MPTVSDPEEVKAQAISACGSIHEAFEILERHPPIGSPVDDDQRKLVISYGHTGYVALYHHDIRGEGESGGAVLITAIRHPGRCWQTEAAAKAEKLESHRRPLQRRPSRYVYAYEDLRIAA